MLVRAGSVLAAAVMACGVVAVVPQSVSAQTNNTALVPPATLTVYEGQGAVTITLAGTVYADEDGADLYASGNGGTAQRENGGTCGAGDDYLLVNGIANTIIINDTDTDPTWSALTLCDDSVHEPPETFELRWETTSGSSPFDGDAANCTSGGVCTTTITVVDDDADAQGRYAVPEDWALLPSGVGGGAEFRLLFRTSSQRDGSATDISVYDTFVQGSASGSSLAGVAALSDAFVAVAGTRATALAVNTGMKSAAADTTFADGSSSSDKTSGVSVHWLEGSKVADSYADFCDGSWANRLPTDGRDENGTALSGGYQTWTGSNGTCGFPAASRAMGESNPVIALLNDSSRGPLNAANQIVGSSNTRYMYALSPTFVVLAENVIVDAELRKVINGYLGRSDTSAAVSASDLDDSRLGTIDAGRHKTAAAITTLEGMQYADRTERLFLDNQRVRNGLDQLKDMAGLKRLTIEFNWMPGEFDATGLGNLEHLWLQNNRLTSIKGLNDLDKLTELRIGDKNSGTPNGNAFVTLDISGLDKLETVYLSNMATLTSVTVKDNPELTSLSLGSDTSHSTLSTVELDNLPELTSLSLGGNRLTKSSLSGLKDLPKLSFLDLEHNQFRGLPKLTHLSGLTQLVLGSNPLRTVNVNKLPTSLVALDVERTGISSIDVTRLTSLEALNVRYNKISTVGAIGGLGAVLNDSGDLLLVGCNPIADFSPLAAFANLDVKDPQTRPRVWVDAAAPAVHEGDKARFTVTRNCIARPAPSVSAVVSQGGYFLGDRYPRTVPVTFNPDGPISIRTPQDSLDVWEFGRYRWVFDIADGADDPRDLQTSVISLKTGITTFNQVNGWVDVQLTGADSGFAPHSDATKTQARQTVTIGRRALTFGYGRESVTRTVSEDAPAGSVVGEPVSAPGGNGDPLAYMLGGADAALFSIDAATGQIRTRTALDYEARSSYLVTVSASDGDRGSASVAVHIEVADVDETPFVTISGPVAVGEGGNAVFTLWVWPRPESPVEVNVDVTERGRFAASGQTGPRTVTVPAAGTARFTVTTLNDDHDEADGSLTATVRPGAGYYTSPTASATSAVRDNDRLDVRLSAPAGDISEGGTKALTLTHNRDLARDESLLVFLAFGGSAEFAHDYRVSGTAAPDVQFSGLDGSHEVSVAFRGGARSATLTLAARPDEAAEATDGAAGETVTVGVDRALLGPPRETPRIVSGQVVFRVLDSSDATVGTASFERSHSTFTENAGAVTVSVALDPAPAADVVLHYGVDGAARTLAVPAGAATAQIPLNIGSVAANRGISAHRITLRAPDGYWLGRHSIHEYSVYDATFTAYLTADDYTPDEGDTVTFTVTLSPRPNRDTDVVVHVSGNHDYVHPDDTGRRVVRIAHSTTSKSFTVRTLGDSTDRGGGGQITVAVAHSSGNGAGGIRGGATLQVSVREDDAPTLNASEAPVPVPPPVEISVTTESGTVTEGDDATFTVTASPAPTADLTVTLDTEETHGTDPDAIAIAGFQSVTIPAGQTSAAYTHTTHDDQTDRGGGTLTVTVRTGDNYTASLSQNTATVTINDDDTGPPPAVFVPDAALLTALTAKANAHPNPAAAARLRKIAAGMTGDVGGYTAAECRQVANSYGVSATWKPWCDEIERREDWHTQNP